MYLINLYPQCVLFRFVLDDFLFEGLAALNRPETMTDAGLARLISWLSGFTAKITFASLGFLPSPPQPLCLQLLSLLGLQEREGKKKQKGRAAVLLNHKRQQANSCCSYWLFSWVSCHCWIAFKKPLKDLHCEHKWMRTLCAYICQC